MKTPVTQNRAPAGQREFKGPAGTTITALAVVMSLYHILYLSHVFERFGWYILAVPHRAITLTFLIVLVFLLFPARRGGSARTLPPWYDFALITLGITGPIYYAISYEKDIVRFTEMTGFTSFELAIGLATAIVVLEGTRRVVGLAMPLVAIGFFLLNFVGSHLPGILYGKSFSLMRVAGDVIYSNMGLYGLVLGVAATLLVAFVIFGAFMETLGGGDFFVKLAMSLFGHFRGGPAKVAVIGSAAFGTISGAGVANVATTGTFTIPMMKGVGYKPEFAAAVEAVASMGGQVMPPVMGVVAFIMADWLGISYWSVVVAAFLPAMLYYFAVFVAVDFEAQKEQLSGLPRSQLPPVRDTLAKGWQFVIPIAVLVFFIGVMRYSVVLAVLYSLGSLLIVSSFRRETRPNWRKLIGGLRGGATGMLQAGIACGTAGIVIGSLQLSGLGLRLSDAIVGLSGGNVLIMLCMALLACYVLGMGMGGISLYVMLAVFVAPALAKAGVLLLGAHLAVFWWGLASYLTPPVAIAAYVAAGIAGSNPMRTGWTATRLGIVTLIVPFVWVYNPALLMRGSPAEVALAAITGLIGVYFMASALSGFLFRRTSWAERIPCLLASMLLIVPGWESDLVGLALALPVAGRQWRAVRRDRNQKPRGAVP